MNTYLNPDAIQDRSIEPIKLNSAIIEVTYTELKALRDNAQLIPGQQYRITDYVTSTTQSDTTSANHQFDIIVTADSESTLNEVARAIQHDGDTYFANSDLNAWEIWYCLDNDTERFAWADNSTVQWYSRIVANYMVDQGGTHTYSLDKDAYIYDYGTMPHPDTGEDTLVFYTQNPIYFEEAGADYGDIYFYNGITTVDGVEYDSWRKFDVQGVYWVNSEDDRGGLYALTERVIYNGQFIWPDNSGVENGKGVIYRMIDEYGNDCPYDFKNIMFKHPKDTTTYPDYYYTFTTLVSDVVSDHSLNNSYCYNNVIKEYNTTLNKNVFINTSTTSNCYCNSFGNGCYSNSFGDRCNSNSFGNDCNYNSFGNYCSDNSFGNYCKGNSFRVGLSNTSNLRDHCNLNKFCDGCKSVILWNSTTASSTSCLQSVNVNLIWHTGSSPSSYYTAEIGRLQSLRPINVYYNGYTTLAVDYGEKWRHITSSTTLTKDDRHVICDNTSAITITLPTGWNGAEYYIHKRCSTSITNTIKTTGSQYISYGGESSTSEQRATSSVSQALGTSKLIWDPSASEWIRIYLG